MLEGMKAMKGYLIDPYVKLITHLVVGPEEVKRLLGAEYDDCELFDDGDHIIVYDAGASEAMTGGCIGSKESSWRDERLFLETALKRETSSIAPSPSMRLSDGSSGVSPDCRKATEFASIT